MTGDARRVVEAESSSEITIVELLGPPAGSESFGERVLVLSNGNYVVVDPDHDGAFFPDVGAVYLYDGEDDSLISRLTGSSAGDRIGSTGLVEVGDSNVVVRSFLWDNGAAADVGAVTWIDGETGLAGTVSAANSLVGSTAGDGVGSSIIVLENGNYVVSSSNWDDGATVDVGASTWGDGNGGVSGAVSAGNSLVGSTAGDRVSSMGATALTNGNYVVASPAWQNAGDAVGAATWVDGATGATGPVTAADSLIGQTAGDITNNSPTVHALANGHYVVRATSWDDPAGDTNVGALTWGDGVGGTSGVITAANSLVGATFQDSVGRVYPLTNGNYMVVTSSWDGPAGADQGAVTWVDGSGPTSDVVAADNSLIGGKPGDQVGFGGGVALTNGNFVANSNRWSSPTTSSVGAGTWMSGDAPTVDIVSADNSLVGSTSGDFTGFPTALANGNYVIESFGWDSITTPDVGAFTWGDGAVGTSGVVSAANSFVGEVTGDAAGAVYPLADGDYVVVSPRRDVFGVVDAGVATVADGTAPLVGASIAGTRSVHGSTANDQLGSAGFGMARTVVAFDDGGFVLTSPMWDNGGDVDSGAATYFDGATDGVPAPIAAGASLVGSAGSLVGENGSDFLVVLDNGDHVVFHAGGTTGFTYRRRGDLTGDILRPGNTAFGDGTGQLLPPGPTLTSDDTVVIPTTENRVVLMKLDLAPEFTSQPPDLTVPAESGRTDAVVDFDLPTAVDRRDGGAVEVVCDPPSGSRFAAGVTTVTCSATDSAGTTASSIFTVTVEVPDIVSLTPGRVLETRPGQETVDGVSAGVGFVAAMSEVEVPVAGRAGVASDAVAVVLNVTAVNPEARGFVTMHPCGERPLASSLNYAAAGDVVGNEVVAKLSSSGSVCIYTEAGTHLTADVTGYVPAAASMTSLVPARVLETRVGQDTIDDESAGGGAVAARTEIEVRLAGRAGVPPSGVSAAIVNVTAVNPAGRGYVTIHPCGELPLASSLNYAVAGDVQGNEVIAKLSTDGTICLYSWETTHLTVDLTGYVPR